MPLKSEWIKYGDQAGYFAVPERAALPLPGVVVIQEIGGVNANIEDITRRIAAAGYAALAPDLWAEGGERPEALTQERATEMFAFMSTLPPASRFDPAQFAAALAELPEPQRSKIGETAGRVFSSRSQMPTYLGSLRKAVGHLRNECLESKGQKVGCVGFCMGGGLSALLACEEPELSGAAVFYGSTPAPEQIAHIQCPVVAFYGGNDQRINAGIPAFEAAMRQAGQRYDYRVYAGANHSFFNDTGPAYEVSAARDAFARLLTFFAQNLTE
jgi:carboxymethylenebutenolidase